MTTNKKSICYDCKKRMEITYSLHMEGKEKTISCTIDNAIFCDNIILCNLFEKDTEIDAEQKKDY